MFSPGAVFLAEYLEIIIPSSNLTTAEVDSWVHNAWRILTALSRSFFAQHATLKGSSRFLIWRRSGRRFQPSPQGFRGFKHFNMSE